jgi:hypothetical protein
MDRHIDSPNPMPRSFVVTNGSNKRRATASLIPDPESAIETVMYPGSLIDVVATI